MEKHFDIICYHKNCPDGIGGLWAANYFKRNTYSLSFFQTGENPSLEKYRGKKYSFVDVCPKVNFNPRKYMKVKKNGYS